MGYYKIGKHKVFYSDDRFTEINMPFLEKLSAHEIISLNILEITGKECKNAIILTNLWKEKLKSDYKKLSKKEFIHKWVEFEFKDENAQGLAWEIIYDYFHLHKNGRIVDLRNFDQKLVEDFTETTYIFPQGESIGLQFMVTHSFLGYKPLEKNTLIFNLNISCITHIKGTLNSLEIKTDSMEIILGKNIKIINKTDC